MLGAPRPTRVGMDRRVRDLLAGHVDAFDRLVALGLLVWALPNVPWWWRPPGHGAATPVVLGVLLLALVQSVPFLWRRRVPGTVLLLAAASLAVTVAADVSPTSAEAAVLVAAYGVGDHGGLGWRRTARVAAAASLTVAVALVVIDPGYRRQAAFFPALLAAAFLTGESASSRRAAVAADAQREHEAERTRIARELHDVVAHQLSAIAVQAGSARVAGARDPAVALEAVAVVERTAREALVELNHLVGMLRRDPDDRLDRGPQPTLADVPALVERAGHGGLPVELTWDGERTALPASIELAVYRIVQEGLTNVLRHAGGAPTRVRVHVRPDTVTVSVEDDGGTPLTPQPAGGGRGLRGLAERVALFGGSLEAAPRPAGGFRLAARIPVGAP